MILDRIRTQPVVLLTLIEAVVYGLTEFGVELTSGQQAAILAVVASVLSIFTWKSVTPTVKTKPDYTNPFVPRDV